MHRDDKMTTDASAANGPQLSLAAMGHVKSAPAITASIPTKWYITFLLLNSQNENNY